MDIQRENTQKYRPSSHLPIVYPYPSIFCPLSTTCQEYHGSQLHLHLSPKSPCPINQPKHPHPTLTGTSVVGPSKTPLPLSANLSDPPSSPAPVRAQAPAPVPAPQGLPPQRADPPACRLGRLRDYRSRRCVGRGIRPRLRLQPHLRRRDVVLPMQLLGCLDLELHFMWHLHRHLDPRLDRIYGYHRRRRQRRKPKKTRRIGRGISRSPTGCVSSANAPPRW